MCTAWILLFAVQTGLIVVRRRDIHRLTGIAALRSARRSSSRAFSLRSADVFLAALVFYDLATRGRLHPATLWGGGFLLASGPLRVAIGYSRPWQDFARMLMG
ncbi:MAG: hypothetical protein ACREM1_22505 [Longimicrobiales bacterium]